MGAACHQLRDNGVVLNRLLKFDNLMSSLESRHGKCLSVFGKENINILPLVKNQTYFSSRSSWNSCWPCWSLVGGDWASINECMQSELYVFVSRLTTCSTRRTHVLVLARTAIRPDHGQSVAYKVCFSPWKKHNFIVFCSTILSCSEWN